MYAMMDQATQDCVNGYGTGAGVEHGVPCLKQAWERVSQSLDTVALPHSQVCREMFGDGISSSVG